jgi:MinD-like ATPase involved in chromosome partitioning or flagellar assembly
MNNLERLKLELSNKQYYTDIEYSVFLEENKLSPTTTYVKADNQINLLETVINILESLGNDVDLMRKIDNKDIITVDQASKYLSQRIYNINAKILKLKEDAEPTTSNISFMFYN